MSNKERFWALLDYFPPRVRDQWDREGEEHLGDPIGLSHGEVTMHAALKAIWYGKGEVDLADLAALDVQFRKPLLEWLADPFFP
jgi:hypothetical protein